MIDQQGLGIVPKEARSWFALVAMKQPASLLQRTLTWVTAIIYAICAMTLITMHTMAYAYGGDNEDEDGEDFPDRTRLHLFEHINDKALNFIITTLLFLITACFIIGYHWLGHKLPAFHEFVPESV